ncbi:MAG TPA: hypothetical protein VGQ68_02155 [Gaiellaceae bacterium]|jgi:hypothetical protein|nr:hypothetical protein [Gaiellaceae bacterium]
MAVEVEIDVATLKSEIKRTYARVSTKPEEDFVFPTGRAWAEDLGYPDELAAVPDSGSIRSRGSPIPSRSAGSSPASACSTSAEARERTRSWRPRWSPECPAGCAGSHHLAPFCSGRMDGRFAKSIP